MAPRMGAGGGVPLDRRAAVGSQWRGLDATSVLARPAVPTGSMAFTPAPWGGLWRLDVTQGRSGRAGDVAGQRAARGRALTLAVSPDFANDGTAFAGEYIDHKGGGQSGLASCGRG